MSLPNWPPLIAALADPRAYPGGVTEVRVIETHISWVFLTGRYAYKVKKPIKLPFLDFSTLERRKYFCEEELRINRRLAPQLYLEVVPIGGTPGAPRISGQPTIEYAVKMLEFPEQARLDRCLDADELPLEPIADFASILAQFHSALPELPNRALPSEEAVAVIRTVRDNLRDVERAVAATPLHDTFSAVRTWSERQCERLEQRIAERLAGRAHKECHGDLHLENLAFLADRIVAFDALEFDASLREIDVISDAGFLAMDLCAHRRCDLAGVFLSRYLEQSGDYEALDVLRFYMVYRALVRAKVRAIKSTQADARLDLVPCIAPYFEVATALIAPRRPLLAITHGPSGCGKTYVSDVLVGTLPALRVRSDLERKRLHGLPPEASSGSSVCGGIYGASPSEEAYANLEAIAERALVNELDLIVDATFLRAAQRDRFRRIAHRCGAGFAIIECAASVKELRRRVAARRAAPQRDASEADLDVLAYQLDHREPLSPDERVFTVLVDTEKAVDFEALTARLRSCARPAPLCDASAE